MGRMDVVCEYREALHWQCEELATSSWVHPKFGMCCYSGKVRLPLFENSPPELLDLLTRQDEVGKKFRDHTRNDNNALAMTSLVVTRIKISTEMGVAHMCLKSMGIYIIRVVLWFHIRGEDLSTPNYISMIHKMHWILEWITLQILGCIVSGDTLQNQSPQWTPASTTQPAHSMFLHTDNDLSQLQMHKYTLNLWSFSQAWELWLSGDKHPLLHCYFSIVLSFIVLNYI